MKPSLTRQSWLTEAERRGLLAILAEKPHLTYGQLGRLFEARFGRRVSRPTICRARVQGFRSLDSTHPRHHLTEAERATLEVICHQAAPRYDRAEIARRFEAGTGRSIARSSVGVFLRRHFDDAIPSGRTCAEGGAPC